MSNRSESTAPTAVARSRECSVLMTTNTAVSSSAGAPLRLTPGRATVTEQFQALLPHFLSAVFSERHREDETLACLQHASELTVAKPQHEVAVCVDSRSGLTRARESAHRSL